MLATVEHYRDIATVPLMSLLASDMPFRDVLVQLMTFATDNGDRPAGCLLTAMRYSPNRLGPATLAKVESITNELLDSYEALYLRAISRGEADPSVPAKLAARYLDMQLTAALLQITLAVNPRLLRKQMGLALKSILPTEDWEKFKA